MKSILADTDLEKLSAIIAEQMGLLFPPSKWKTLEQSCCNAARELGFKDVQECVSRFTSPPPSKELIEAMACYLTIGETYFLREVRCFEILEQQIIPEILKKRQGGEQRLRIWSAGCATGEEPYSIAILLHRMRDSLRGWDISILATDINPHALRKAREGIYTSWSFRASPPWFKESFFRQAGDKQYELLPHIKEMVKFSNINLVEDCFPSLVTDTNAIDVIFCRNVLMYFAPQLAARVVERFRRCLFDDGWLFVSPCETSNPFLAEFDQVSFPDAILYRKSNDRLRSNEPENREKSGPENWRNHAPIQENSLIPKASPVPRFPHSPLQKLAPAPPLSDSPIQEVASPYHKALTLYERGAYGEAVEMVTEQLLQDKNNTHALALLCRIHANEGRLSEALLASDRALAADKLSAGLHYLRAVILQEQGMDDEAVASLKKALYLDQDLVLAHFTLANLEQRKGKIKESQRHFNNALSLLDRYRPDDVIPESDGMFAERLKEIIRASTAKM
ncbi:MAG TPA: chemotaxis protein CheR [Geobacter sp.]|nr:chemotaxis protein CheR [Geobacter sp.]